MKAYVAWDRSPECIEAMCPWAAYRAKGKELAQLASLREQDSEAIH